MSKRPTVLVMITVKDAFLARLRERYDLVVRTDKADAITADASLAAALAPVRAVITNGSAGLSDALMARMPRLEIACCTGAGFENVDLDAARRRKVRVTHSPGANDATVADHALGLMLALARGYVDLDRAVREGRWTSSRADRPTLNGRRLGLIGLGNIGRRIAQRAAAFDMTIGYHARNRRDDVPHAYHDDKIALAAASDFLVVACPGGPSTRKLVDAAVLDALGRRGYLINIARGSIVDTDALVAALVAGGIAGAGLDVVAGEPEVPAALLAAPNVVFTPHVAGRSPEAMEDQYRAVEANLAACFAGDPPVSPVPGSLR